MFANLVLDTPFVVGMFVRLDVSVNWPNVGLFRFSVSFAPTEPTLLTPGDILDVFLLLLSSEN